MPAMRHRHRTDAPDLRHSQADPTMSARAWLSLSITAALWGASYMFIKVALDGGLSEGFIIAARTLIGAAVLAPMAIRAGAIPMIMQRKGYALALAAAQVIVPFGLITFGENHVPSSLAGILVATAPLFIAILAVKVDPDERSHGWGLVGVLVGMVGVVLLFGLDLSGDADTVIGGLMIVGSGLCYAIAVLIAKRGFTGVPPVGVAASNLAIAGVLWLPIALASLPTHNPGTNAILSMLALSVGGTGIAFLFFYTSIAQVGPARASMVSYVAPAFSVVYGVILLGEDLTVATVAGLVLILAGSWLAASGRLPKWLSRSEPSHSSAPEPARAR
jgi:drug/metabolite transporter (DMT)-like permease